MRDHVYFVYMLASGRNGTLYVGVTSDLVKRVQEHREQLAPGFTRKYRVDLLVYWELHHDINEAILREKRIKRWHRKWKLALIEAMRSGGTCGSIWSRIEYVALGPGYCAEAQFRGDNNLLSSRPSEARAGTQGYKLVRHSGLWVPDIRLRRIPG